MDEREPVCRKCGIATRRGSNPDNRQERSLLTNHRQSANDWLQEIVNDFPKNAASFRRGRDPAIVRIRHRGHTACQFEIGETFRNDFELGPSDCRSRAALWRPGAQIDMQHRGQGSRSECLKHNRRARGKSRRSCSRAFRYSSFSAARSELTGPGEGRR